LADDRGRPVAFALTPGNVADITMAIPLLAAVDKPRRLLADKAYDADSFRNWLKRRKIKAVIPSTATRRIPYSACRRAKFIPALKRGAVSFGPVIRHQNVGRECRRSAIN
jgi:IS5 family transposase